MMKKILFLILISCTIESTIATESKLNSDLCKKTETTVQDYIAVKKTLNNYIEAGKKGDSKILRPSVYKNAIIYSAPSGKVQGGTINALFEYIDDNPAAAELEADITTLDIVGDIAYAKVEANNWHGTRYTDMFLLVKDGNEWKILTKTFYTHK